jgi:hypothetical protein
LDGNYTSVGDLNASFVRFSINGGNLGNITVFNSGDSGTNETYEWINFLVLTVSPTSYLYVDIQRTDVESGPGVTWGNCTLRVETSMLSINRMDFDLTDNQNWNSERLDGEVKSTDFLFEEIPPAEFPSGGMDLSDLLPIGAAVVVVGGIAGGIFYFKPHKKILEYLRNR